MAELLSTDQVTVLGGPSKIAVDLDFGPTGRRGSNWYVGNGNPSGASIGATVQVFDLYMNVDSEDDEYLWMYQYQSIDGTNSWQRILKIIPNLVSRSILSDFVSGETEVLVPLIDILPPTKVGTAEVSDFNIQTSIANANPIIPHIKSLEIITSNSVQILKIVMGAVDLQETEWVPIEGQKVVNLLISVV